jgi:predicted ester cyclase
VSSAELEALAEAWSAAWTGAGDFADCCAANVRYEDPLTVDPLEGIAALAEHAGRLRLAFTDLRLERNAPPLGSDCAFACLPWRALGTHKGELPSLPPTGRFVVLQGLHYVELSDGRVCRARGFFDLYDAAVQLGLLPGRGSFGEAALLLLRGFGLRPRS